MADQQLNEKQLQALLRIKRYEQPPPGYFDDLLANIQKRQRAEMLRRPAWRLALERVKTFAESLRVDWPYAASMAGILITGIAIIQMSMPKHKSAPVAAAVALPDVQHATVAYQPALTLKPQAQIPQARKLPPALQRIAVPSRPGSQPAPQFVGGGLPESYEATQIRF